MKFSTHEPWISLAEIAEDPTEDPETRLVAALGLIAAYEYILKTERVGDEVPDTPENVDIVDKNELST